MDQLVLVERLILESLSHAPKNLYQLTKDTSLDSLIVTNIISSFLNKSYVIFINGRFELTPQFYQKNLPYINREKQKLHELKSLMRSMINCLKRNNQNSNIQFKIKKHWLTQREFTILQSHLKVIECFFIDIEKEHKIKKHVPQQQYTTDKKVVFWGVCDYKDLVKTFIATLKV